MGITKQGTCCSIVDRGGSTSVHAEDALLDASGQGEPVEAVVEARPGHDARLVPHALYALYPEAEQRIDVRSLHVPQACRQDCTLPHHLHCTRR